MQLKNNEARHNQFYFRNDKNEVDVVHIPAGATVEIEDKIFQKLLAPKTTVEEQKEVLQEIVAETPITMDKQPVFTKEYYSTGVTRSINLVEAAIKAGRLTIVEHVATSDEDKAKFLNSKGVATKDLKPEQLAELYNKLV